MANDVRPIQTLEEYAADSELHREVEYICETARWLGHDAPIMFTDIGHLVNWLAGIAYTAQPHDMCSKLERTLHAEMKAKAEQVMKRFAASA